MKIISILLSLLLLTLLGASEVKPWSVKLNTLTKLEKNVIVNKGTERAFSGKYVDTTKNGVYKCKLCGSKLYSSKDKFSSHCGWPSFDDAIDGAVKEIADKDGRRIEIVCANCNGHLGHVFRGEKFTKKNVRHCVNSISLEFDKAKDTSMKKAYFAGGCFWGVEYYLEQIDGVKEVKSGFMGGDVKNPTYSEVVRKKTGHLETVEVIYDSSKVSYETLARNFFEIHNPTQKNGQGPDIGSQYLSAVFVSNEIEKKIIDRLISILKSKGYNIVTKVLDKSDFYSADEHHQDYYRKKGTKPYCHIKVKRFN